jgi:nucleoside-diphosphate-sugar epimerase
VLTEDSPHGTHTRKGAVRLAMAEQLERLRDAGELDVVQVRASDFYGPGAGGQSPVGDRVLEPVTRGRTAWVLGDPDQPHSYTYVPDVARTLATLGLAPDAAGVWHVPNDPARTTRELLQLAARLAGRDGARVRRTPTWVLRALGLRNPSVREVVEMEYEFDEPFVVSGARTTDRFGIRATPVETGMAQTLADLRTSHARRTG